MLIRPLLIFALLLGLPECIFSKSLEYVYGDTLKEKEVILETSTGNLSGTLTIPENEPKAVIIIISGSGPTDRNGNGPRFNNNSLKYLSDTLSANALTVLRYDKRGIAASKGAGKSEKEMRFEDMVNDALLWINWLKEKYPDLPLFVIGHSEGALVGMIAGKKAEMNGYISLCGPAFPADSVLKEQLMTRSPILAEYCAPKLDSIKMGLWVKEKNPMLQSILRESVQPYLHSWMQYDPTQEARSLTIPSLFIGGGEDLQVPTDHALILAESAPDGYAFVVEDMNHILKQITGNRLQNTLSYNDPDLPLHKRLAEETINFIEKALNK